MKIAVRRTYYGDRLCFPGAVPDALVDVRGVYARMLMLRDGLERDDAIVRTEHTIAADLPGLLRDDAGLGEVRRVHDWALERAQSGDLHEGCTWSQAPELLGAPVGRPHTVWGMSGNYPREAADPAAAGSAQPERPAAPPNQRGFLKAAGALAGPYDNIRYPSISHHVVPEIELAAVIGRRCHRLRREEAMSAVAGYVVLCDIGARDIGAMDNRALDRAKGFDTFAVIGPWFVTADEIPDPHKLRIRAWVNGQVRQDGNTAGMLHDLPEQLEWLSSALTLRPGDVVSTGTPPGPAPIEPGDVLRGEIDGLGVLECAVVAESDAGAA
ncbi:fumarylacetoacetate hydrolase family protein [Actinospica sp.]|jgi:2-keto-4-pentenoate hydratase/2-oxohepta-3-ene-1,7-dioic acid hydratase in catechol pathway|uniref:fumarylacetoacetate hydrolase family protein n=1 Tax=Actinospica sp. TaxID=1872142 RepID=UPI002CCEAF08|nr:fumarylacetoacetate hydrolase family protein [Actinospica sp.]HWG25587.1 fumarylacetoacetate hydrolase family protein [Actinospica sp.]